MALNIDDKYIATLYSKISLKENEYIFIPMSFSTGKINLETKHFVDEIGVEYPDINDESIDKISTCYSSLCSISKLRDHFTDDKAYKDALDTYTENSMNSIVYIKTSDDGHKNKIELNLKDLINNPIQLNNHLDEEQESKGFIDLEEELIKELEEGKYNKKELEELRRNLIENDKVIERILNLINITIGRKSRETSNDFYKKLEADMYTKFTKLSNKVTTGDYSLTELFNMNDKILNINKFINGIQKDIEYQIFATSIGEGEIELPQGEDDDTIKELIIEDMEQKNTEQTEMNINKDSYKELGIINVKEVLEKIKKTLIGQDEPAKHLLIELNSIISGGKKTPMLITGDTGVGKTLLMSLIGKELNRPFYKIDSTKLTIPGYVGTDIEEELWRLYEQCGKDLNKAEHAIIFFDEIDKKGSANKSDVSGQGVLNVLLSFLEGGTYQACESMSSLRGQRVTMSTKNMIIIVGGAFKDVYDTLNSKRDIGFGVSNKKVTTPDEEDFRKKAGMTAEFMGRLPIRIRLNDLDEDKLFHILKDSDKSAVLERKNQFEKHGVMLTVTDEYLKELSKEAIKKKTGARGLDSAVYETTWEALGDVNENLGEYSEIIVTDETVKDPSNYEKVYRKNKEVQ